MKNYVIINGTNSNTITGLMINELPPISKPQMRTMIEEIDGRDGDIITDLGYSSYDKTFTIGLFGTGYDINEIISFFNDSGTITFSNEPDKYYYFKAISKIDYERLQKFKTATITFHCQPYKYPTSETPIEISYEYVEQENVESANMTNTEGDTFLKISPKGNTSQTGTPTPDSPQPINVVSGDNEITISNSDNTQSQTYPINLPVENILDTTTYPFTLKSAYSSNGSEATWNGYVGIREYLPVKPNTSYAFSSNLNKPIQRIIMYDSSKNIVSSNTTNKYTFTTGNDVYYIRFCAEIEEIPTWCQLEYGEKTNHYTPYGTTPIELCKIGDYQDYFTKNSGKNLFDKDNANVINGYINANGTITSNNNDRTIYISCLPNTTYTFQKMVDSTTANNRLRLMTSSNTPTINTTGEDFIKYDAGTTITNVSITTSSSAKYLIVYCYNDSSESSTSFSDMLASIQIEKGSSVSPYEPYGTNQWCKYNAIGKTTDTIGSNSKTISDMVSNANVYSYCGGSVSNKTITYTSALVVENTIYYPLAPPYLSLITDNTLINQLDNIENAFSYEGTTNVNQINNDKPFLLDLKAMKKDTNETIVNNTGNTTSKPTIALEGTGDINIYLNGTQMLKATLTDKMTIDTNNMEAYNPDTSALLNRHLVGDISKFTLSSGNNTIKMDGDLTKATITDYVRWL